MTFTVTGHQKPTTYLSEFDLRAWRHAHYHGSFRGGGSLGMGVCGELVYGGWGWGGGWSTVNI